MHGGVVNSLAGREVSTNEIANVDMLHASIYDSSWDVTKCELIVELIGSGDASLPCIYLWSWSSHFASQEPSEQAMYAASRVDIAIRSCYCDCHVTAPLLRRNT